MVKKSPESGAGLRNPEVSHRFPRKNLEIRRKSRENIILMEYYKEKPAWMSSKEIGECFLVYPMDITEDSAEAFKKEFLELPMFYAIDCNEAGILSLYDPAYSQNELLCIMRQNLPIEQGGYELWISPEFKRKL